MGFWGLDFIICRMSVFALGLNHSDRAAGSARSFCVCARSSWARRCTAFAAASAPTASPKRRCCPPATAPSCTSAPMRPNRGSWSRPAIDWLAAHGSVSGDKLLDHTYVLEDRAAARHAFRVASGLDSMVLGEPQILGQMKEAVRQAEERRHAGHHAAPVVPALVFGGQGSAQRHRDRRPFDQHGGGVGAAGRAVVRGPGANPRAVRRRRRDDRTGGHALCGAQPQGHGGGQPHAGTRRKAGQPLRRAMRCAWPTCRRLPA